LGEELHLGRMRNDVDICLVTSRAQLFTVKSWGRLPRDIFLLQLSKFLRHWQCQSGVLRDTSIIVPCTDLFMFAHERQLVSLEWLQHTGLSTRTAIAPLTDKFVICFDVGARKSRRQQHSRSKFSSLLTLSREKVHDSVMLTHSATSRLEGIGLAHTILAPLVKF
jgi:hypothetical protein